MFAFLAGPSPRKAIVGSRRTTSVPFTRGIRPRGKLRRPLADLLLFPPEAGRLWRPFRLLFENSIASTSNLCSPSYKEPTVDALAPEAEEGRGWLR
jgi:hypothetical protein